MELLLLRLADRIVNFQNSFVSRISSKHATSIRHWYKVHMASRNHIKFVSTSCFYCDNSYYLHNCSACNSPLCLRSNNHQFVFDFAIIVVAVISYSFVFRSIKGRLLAILFGFYILNFPVKIIVYLFCTFIMIDINNVKYKCKNNKFSSIYCTSHTLIKQK